MKLRSLDWEALAGIVAAVAALVLHLLHVVEPDLLLAVIMVVLALMLLRDLRRERRDEEESAAVEELKRSTQQIAAALVPPDVILIGPRDLRSASERFARQSRGEMIWFNVCLSMFEPQELFDVLLKPALDNPRVTAVHFVLPPSESDRWQAHVLPKVARHPQASKLRPPRWAALEETVSFVLADGESGSPEAQLSFWGEPFMARHRGRDIPRYVLHVRPGSELISRLIEIERGYRGTT